MQYNTDDVDGIDLMNKANVPLVFRAFAESDSSRLAKPEIEEMVGRDNLYQSLEYLEELGVVRVVDKKRMTSTGKGRPSKVYTLTNTRLARDIVSLNTALETTVEMHQDAEELVEDIAQDTLRDMGVVDD